MMVPCSSAAGTENGGVPYCAPDRETPTHVAGYTHLEQCDTRSHEGSGSKIGPGIVFDPVAILCVRSQQWKRAKPPEKSKGSPNQAGKPDQAKVGRVNVSESLSTRRKSNRSSKYPG